MNYGFSDVQKMLQDAARQFFEHECPTTRVREIEASPTGHDAALWQRLGDLGWLELGVAGSDGASFVDALLLADEAGRAVAPVPFIPSIVVCASLISELDADQVHAERLAELKTGSTVAAFAMNEADVVDAPQRIATSASPDGNGGWRLNGEKYYVENAAAADSFLVLARTGVGPFDLGLFVVDRDAVEVVLDRTVAGDTLGVLTFRDTPGRVLGSPNAVWPATARAIDRARIAQSAKIVGMATSSLERATDYSKTRVQFGRPIGTFQTLQHRMADLTTEREATRFLTYHAGWLVDQGEAYAVAAAMALHSAIDVAERLAIETAHIFGGYGVSVEHDIQLYYRRLRAAQMRWGDGDMLLETVTTDSIGAAS